MILICFGTRPEWLKIKPIINILKREEYRLLFTGQHPDLLKDVNVDYKIVMTSGDNRLNQVISDCLLQFPKGDFTSVLVQGDTASAYACGLAAFNRGIRVVYLEAGLRSYDLMHPYPEEAYRQMLARIANVNFAPTSLSRQNLQIEKVSGDIYVTGNTVLDNLRPYRDICEYQDKVLVTLHRRENHFWMDRWFYELEKLARDYSTIEFILPIHPNPNVRNLRYILKTVNVVEPLEHDALLNILVKCKLVISDSGGLQEEGSFFNKKVIVCRKTTERPEGIDTGHLYLCNTPEDLRPLFDNLIKNHYINTTCPYGDGRAAEKVVDILKSLNV